MQRHWLDQCCGISERDWLARRRTKKHQFKIRKNVTNAEQFCTRPSSAWDKEKRRIQSVQNAQSKINVKEHIEEDVAGNEKLRWLSNAVVVQDSYPDWNSKDARPTHHPTCTDERKDDATTALKNITKFYKKNANTTSVTVINNYSEEKIYRYTY